MTQKTPIAFLSYARIDDTYDQGKLTQLRNRLSLGVRVCTGKEFHIFQDRQDIQWGQPWVARLRESLEDVVFLIPIITPSFWGSEWCREELKLFLEREESLGRNDLILPIYYRTCKIFEDIDLLNQDELASSIHQRQMEDWRLLRGEPLDSPVVAEKIERMAEQIGNALSRAPLSTQISSKQLISSQVPFSSNESSSKIVRIFLSYKRNVGPDEPLALELAQSLNQQYSVFIDKSMLVGTLWAERIKLEIQQADALIVLLSEKSVHSEMVQTEVSLAHETSLEQNGRPIILPVRLAYQEPFQYPLSAYLDPINWAVWYEPKDTPRLLSELEEALAGHSLPVNTIEAKTNLLCLDSVGDIPRPSPSAQPKDFHPRLLESPEGTMDPESDFYIERKSDKSAVGVLRRQGVTLVIKGPRQMGKSSLLLRVVSRAKAQNKKIAFLDFQLFDKRALKNADDFFLHFCSWLTHELNLENRLEEHWSSSLGNNIRCTDYVGKYVLPSLSAPLMLAMDEVETVFDTPFRSDFFGMLRNWHNRRAMRTIDPVWRQLDLALVTSTEPYQLIDNLEQSPFNVGKVVKLEDFTIEQVSDLNEKHENPLTEGQVLKLIDLISGHPYLTRRALFLVATDIISTNELFNQAFEEKGPFGDHLRWHLFRIYDKPHLVSGLLQVIHRQSCPDERVFFRLQGAGLVQREGKRVIPRCQLYAEYFKEHLSG
jgi:hypothetical protein